MVEETVELDGEMILEESIYNERAIVRLGLEHSYGYRSKTKWRHSSGKFYEIWYDWHEPRPESFLRSNMESAAWDAHEKAMLDLELQHAAECGRIES